ncbi:hypothetical protein MMC12_002787 [Toensbergia leucococca]|nr:hypothetical protein [Toensbergia leucococca]
MILRRLQVSRNPYSIRPLPSPNIITKPLPNPRLFTQNTQLLLVSSPSSRPQLPFLHHPSGLRPPQTFSRGQFQFQISRLLTTERKQYIKSQLRLASKYTIYAWSFICLFAVILFGVQNERLDRKYPSPPMWTWLSRMTYRNARGEESPSANATGLIDWASTGNYYRQVLRRLEDPSKDGSDLQPTLQDEGDIYVAGVGRTGLDISAKPEPWRRGYHTCLMGAARAAEHLDGWVRDKSRNIAFPSDVVIGPSNPRPKPVPPGAKSAPLEENCEQAFESPESYYMKILTTHGFSTQQRLEAALAYADWLDFKELPSSAEEMYDWGLDIATGSLPVGVDNVVDTKTGIINKSADYISSNVLLATTSLAIHHARNNNLSTALPIFLSVLRARRHLPPVPPTVSITTAPEPESEPSTFQTLLSFSTSFIVDPAYPDAPLTGDEIPYRCQTSICEEAGLMAYIGEILFASPSPKVSHNKPTSRSAILSSQLSQAHNQQEGLGWTRDSVDIAEATLASIDQHDPEARKRCSECLEVGMDNWSKMVGRMLKDELARELQPKEKEGGSWSWGSAAREKHEGRWEREAKLIEERAVRVKRLLAREEQRVNDARSGGRFGMLFG